MKKILIFVVVLSAFVTHIYGQEIHFPTSDDNPVWQIRKSDLLNETETYSTYGMIGDTTINSFKYYKIYNISDTIPIKENINNYYRAIREDIDNQKVYIIERGQTQEQLLYDFSAEINDTIVYDNAIFYYDYCGVYPIVIDTLLVINVDSISLRNLKLKRIFVSDLYGYFYEGEWIQGIGNLYMPFIPAVVFQDCGLSEGLSCFKRNDTICYPRCKCFHVVTSLKDFKNKNSLDIYPNPAHNFIDLSSLAGMDNKTLYVKLSDYTGRIVLNKLMDNTYILSLPDLDSGLYFLRIYDSSRNLLMIEKIIIQN